MPDSAPTNPVKGNSSVLDALEQQVKCYQRLAKLAIQQHEFVRQSQTEELLSLLARRQTELDQIQTLEQTIALAKRNWSDYLPTLANDQRERAQKLMDQTRRLLEEITMADKDDALLLQQRKIDVGRQLAKATVGARVTRSYAAAAYAKQPKLNLVR